MSQLWALFSDCQVRVMFLQLSSFVFLFVNFFMIISSYLSNGCLDFNCYDIVRFIHLRNPIKKALDMFKRKWRIFGESCDIFFQTNPSSGVI